MADRVVGARRGRAADARAHRCVAWRSSRRTATPVAVGGLRLPRRGQHVPRLLRLVPRARDRADGAGEPGAARAAGADASAGPACSCTSTLTWATALGGLAVDRLRWRRGAVADALTRAGATPTIQFGETAGRDLLTSSINAPAGRACRDPPHPAGRACRDPAPRKPRRSSLSRPSPHKPRRSSLSRPSPTNPAGRARRDPAPQTPPVEPVETQPTGRPSTTLDHRISTSSINGKPRRSSPSRPSPTDLDKLDQRHEHPAGRACRDPAPRISTSSINGCELDQRMRTRSTDAGPIGRRYSSSASSASTRALMSSRIGRTSSIDLPLGSTSSQSS